MMASNQESPGIKLKPSKKRRLSTNYDKCIKCQTTKINEKLQSGMQSSIIKFVHCAKLRNDEVFRRIEQDIEGKSLRSSIEVKWHKSCYSSYTSNENVKYFAVTPPSQTDDIPSLTPMLRSTTCSTNWQLCFVCQKGKCKGEKDLAQVASQQVSSTMLRSAEYRNDEEMIRRIRNEDLIAVKAKYHRGCYQRYTVVVSTSKADDELEKGKYDLAFCNLIEKIGHKLISEERAYDMSTLLNMYKVNLTDAGLDKDTADSYKVQNLKKRLVNKYGATIAFHSQVERNKSELVCSATLNLGEIINLVAEVKGDCAPSTAMSSKKDTYNQVLYHAAMILRNEIKDVKGIETSPLNVSDLTLEKATELVPSRLQLFLRWLTQSQRVHDTEVAPIDDQVEEDEVDMKADETRKILAIGQDIIACNSSGRKKMPKNVGLGIALKTMVRGKEIITMLNHHGHCVNYWDCEQTETRWAEISLNRFDEGEGYYQAILPSSIEPDVFAQCAADNADYVEDTLDGKDSVHVMSIAFYQGGFPLNPNELTHEVRSGNKIRQRALKAVETKFYELPFLSKTPAPTIIKRAKKKFFEKCSNERETIQGLNRVWLFTRNTPTRLLEVEIEQSSCHQRVPGWTGFHAIVSVHYSQPSRIGFPPLIPAPLTEPSTVYTCLKGLEKTFRESLCQKNCVITFDEGIYCEAKRIQWAVSPELDNVVIRMGGFHRAKNFISVIGKRMAESGIEDLWMESDVCGSNVASKIINGSHYNRAVRVHKLTLEALQRLQWQSFTEWLQEQNLLDAVTLTIINEKKNALITTFQNGYEYAAEHKKDIQQQVLELDSLLSEKLNPLFNEYKEHACNASSLFSFWNEYIEMVWLLLDLIYSDRNANWNLHLDAFTEMLPYDKAFDHLNYFRWGTVYITDMRRLSEDAPEVYREFTENQAHAVSTTSSISSFNRVSPDMALEQTINRDSKTKGGIVGVSGTQGTRDKRALSAHMMATATKAVKVMSGMATAPTTQKEFGKERLQRDESDVLKIMKCIDTKMKNPFDISEYEGEKLPLINIASGTVAPTDVCESLLSAKEQGKNAMDEFVQERLVLGETNFWEPIKKTNIKTFQSLTKPIKVTKDKQNLKIINIDRQVYGRLLVISKDRDVDLKNVLSYELAPVPLSLANMDGSLRKTQKSNLLKELNMECNAQTVLPGGNNDQTAYVIDLLAIIQMTSKGNLKTFGELSDVIATSVMAKFHFAFEVHVVPDRYDVEHSIKAGERSRRSQWRSIEVKIQGQDTKLPSCLKRYLSNGKNKSNLLSFLVDDWSKRLPLQLKDGQALFLASQNGKAMKITNSMVEKDIPSLRSDHEEADSRMFVHCEYFAKTSDVSPKRIIMFSPNTDVAVLCWHHFNSLMIDELWFHTGTGRNKKYIPVHTAVNQVGTEVCQLLPAMHALTGCDSTSSLHGIGKKSALSVMRKHHETFELLSELGANCSIISDEIVRLCLTFIGHLYGEHTSDLNRLRYHLFTKKCLDSSKLPPTEDSARHHIQRANYQCFIWKNALSGNQAVSSPIGNGWTTDDSGNLVPMLMSNNPAPESLLELTVCRCKTGCTSRCSCRRANLACTLSCHCNNNCQNNTSENGDEEAE